VVRYNEFALRGVRRARRPPRHKPGGPQPDCPRSAQRPSSSFRICGARHPRGRAAGCVNSRPGETGPLLGSHPLSIGRAFPFRALDWASSGRQATFLSGRADRRQLPLGGGSSAPPAACCHRISPSHQRDLESGPVAPAPRRSPGVRGCQVPDSVPVYEGPIGIDLPECPRCPLACPPVLRRREGVGLQ
jgi:hypothetical protein